MLSNATCNRYTLDVYRRALGDHAKTADVAMSLGLALLGQGNEEEEKEGEALYQEVGLYKLNPVYPKLEGVWFQPLSL